MAKKKEKKTIKNWKNFLKIGLGIVIVLALISVILPFSLGTCIKNWFTYIDHPLPSSVDICTMEMLHPSSRMEIGYFKDKDNVYAKNGILIEEADPNTYEYLGVGYGKDDSGVYLNESIINGADPSSFTQIDRNYAIDRENVYYKGLRLDDANTTTFEILGGLYSTDGENVYYMSNPIPDASAATFEVMGDGYSFDASKVYYNGNTISRDPEFFDIVLSGRGYAVDSENIYYNGEVISNNPKLLIVTPGLNSSLTWATDGSSVYVNGIIVPNVTSDGFELLEYKWGKTTVRTDNGQYKVQYKYDYVEVEKL